VANIGTGSFVLVSCFFMVAQVFGRRGEATSVTMEGRHMLAETSLAYYGALDEIDFSFLR
jgi:hypothetical protein